MALDLGIREKIQKLKEKYLGEAPEALQQIEAWEVRLQELSQLDDYANLNTTREIVMVIKSRLKDVILKRALGKGMTDLDHKVLDAREEELRFVLAKILPPFNSEIGQIETLIDSELAP